MSLQQKYEARLREDKYRSKKESNPMQNSSQKSFKSKVSEQVSNTVLGYYWYMDRALLTIIIVSMLINSAEMNPQFTAGATELTGKRTC